MLPPRCSQPPCMNMLESKRQVDRGGAWFECERAARHGHGARDVLAGGDLARHSGPGVREGVVGQLQQDEDDNVDGDQRQGDDREAAPGNVLIGDRQHAPIVTRPTIWTSAPLVADPISSNVPDANTIWRLGQFPG